VKQSLICVHKRHSKFEQRTAETLVQLTLVCLNNVITQHGQNYYTHSVSLTNIVVHYTIRKIAGELKKTELFKRFIDDFIWVSFGKQQTECIKYHLQEVFEDFDLDLDFRQVKTNDIGGKVEFLDVCHHITDFSIFGFVTKDHIKPTALDRYFLNGASHHPQSTFKYIVYSEAICLRRLNERQSDFNKSLDRLFSKAFKIAVPQKDGERHY